jgi:hypothetical protein
MTCSPLPVRASNCLLIPTFTLLFQRGLESFLLTQLPWDSAGDRPYTLADPATRSIPGYPHIAFSRDMFQFCSSLRVLKNRLRYSDGASTAAVPPDTKSSIEPLEKL